MSFFVETLVGGLLAGVMYSLVAIGFGIGATPAPTRFTIRCDGNITASAISS